MMHYHQFCPIAKAAEIVAERWTPLVGTVSPKRSFVGASANG